MGKFTFTPTGIAGMMVVEPTLFGDARGYFMETYNYNEFAAAGLDTVSYTHLLYNISLIRKHLRQKIRRKFQRAICLIAIQKRGFCILKRMAIDVYKRQEKLRSQSLYVACRP